jgi:putative phosphoribosyl transferase
LAIELREFEMLRYNTLQPLFRDRAEAGRVLAERLKGVVGSDPDVIVLALPRGGVPVAYEVARAFNAGLDVILVRKLGVPRHEELAMGAIASGGIRVLNDVVEQFGIPQAIIDEVTRREQKEIAGRERLYRQGRPPQSVSGRTIILVDDGLATGSTMLAAVQALRAQRPKRIIVAVPVASPEVCRQFESYADATVCVATPDPFYAVGLWYEDFSQTSDAEVRQFLTRTADRNVA